VAEQHSVTPASAVAELEAAAIAALEAAFAAPDCWQAFAARRPREAARFAARGAMFKRSLPRIYAAIGSPARCRRMARARGAGRPAARRTSRATRAGPDDDPDSEPPPRPKRRGVYSYACSPCPHCGAELRLYVDGLWCPNESCLWGGR
jgi:hypothetical protein